jgi:hypothetical protein
MSINPAVIGQMPPSIVLILPSLLSADLSAMRRQSADLLRHVRFHRLATARLRSRNSSSFSHIADSAPGEPSVEYDLLIPLKET